MEDIKEQTRRYLAAKYGGAAVEVSPAPNNFDQMLACARANGWLQPGDGIALSDKGMVEVLR